MRLLLSFFLRDVLDEIWDLIESVSEGVPTYSCKPYSSQGFFEISEDMLQILLMLEILLTQDSKDRYLFFGTPSGSEPSLFFSNYLFGLGFKPVQDDFRHDFAHMTDEAHISIILQSNRLPF